MEEEEKTYLTSSEIAALWTGFMNDSMSNSMLGFMLKDIKDSEIKAVVEQAYRISEDDKEELQQLFERENFAIPNGFGEEDANMNAPWLFTDIFCLTYVSHMARVGMVTYSGFIAMSVKKEIRDLFTNRLKSISDLYNQAMDIALKKGINSRYPYIETPKETDFVDSKNYMSGLNPFSEKRPLNSVELSHLYMNILTNSMGIKLCIAFAQTSPSKVVQDYMLRAKGISQKHIKMFVDKMMKDDIQAPQLPDVGVSDSTTQTFSDKLLMFHMSLISSAGIGNYATAGAASQRMDLVVNYQRLSVEVARLAKSGADIMIDNNWLEQPPGIKDREKLARNKGDSDT